MNSDLAWEAEAGSDARHGCRDEVVEVTVGRSGELECTEADVVQSLVVNAVSFVRVLNQLMHGQCCIVRLNNRVRHLNITATSSINFINAIANMIVNNLCFSFNFCIFNIHH